MENQDPIEDQDKKCVRRRHFYQTARKVMLASVGAMALAQDELEDFVNRLTEKGELAEGEGRKLIEEIKERRRARLEKAGSHFSNRLEKVLKRLDTPTKADIESLNEKVATLSEKLDKILEQQSK